MANYASIKAPATSRQKATRQRAQSAVLDEAQQAAIEANRAFVRQYMPEIEPLIRAFYAEGLIDGWRSVKNCEISSNEGKNFEAAHESQ